MNIQLPPALEAFREKLVTTRQAFIRVKPQKARKTAFWNSKVGGQPYLPTSQTWPLSPDGRPLVFLAQINFAEMPRLEPFPEKGIVQFFIYDDDLYGMNFEDGEKADTFRVLYHPEVVEKISHNEPPFEEYDDVVPHHPETEHQLLFELAEEIVPLQDFRFWEHFGHDFFQQFGEAEWDIQENYSKLVRSDGHKVGGYAYFTQDDPRTKDNPMLLLFQLDSDEMMDLMWGDMGVGHFFIREQDLRDKRFDRVLYDWDCM